MVAIVASCTAIFVILVRSRRKRRKTIFAPCWRIPGCYDCTYQPPTPPYSGSPKNDTDQRKCDSKAIADSLPLTIDAEPSLLSVIRRSDVKAVKEMISSKEFFEDAVLCGYERTDEKPILFAAEELL
ncbi:hypothetical protein KIN20_028117 [Parelaphostrongylus tenuis]|uniref:Uncharacterized protein n=1 Tax=Parelaphostrongylus tenuis TaxID=148309 RepID=A0AAD5R0C8_PARTN|nr:hypothetical protein KIN20_028117 [Parelaphostrongylus tenuis]